MKSENCANSASEQENNITNCNLNCLLIKKKKHAVKTEAVNGSGFKEL